MNSRSATFADGDRPSRAYIDEQLGMTELGRRALANRKASTVGFSGAKVARTRTGTVITAELRELLAMTELGRSVLREADERAAAVAD